jgi:crotonobetainyl-CoA:carnitine CoA-transferase CaiB-like acyl-CoA transferase
MELTEEADFEQRGIMQTMEHPIAGPFKMPGWPVRFGAARRKSSRRRCLDNTQVKF